jgi:ComF family protein
MKNTEKIKAFGEVLKNSLYPLRCPVCGEIAEPAGNRICAGCVRKLDFVKEPACLKCGRGMTNETAELCYDCTVRPKSFDYGFPLLNYDDLMRESMSQIKYRSRPEYIEVYARLIALKHGERIRKMQADALVPVPVHPSRLRERGYNQAELLARGIAEYTGLPVRTDILFRTRKTVAQKKLTPEERLKNLTGAFSAFPLQDGIKSIILADDIYTTGSTIEACTRVLRKAGAEHVFYLSICIVPEA